LRTGFNSIDAQVVTSHIQNLKENVAFCLKISMMGIRKHLLF
jgi:hypothetical protein